MSEPRNHHYVPKGYLKAFANEKEEIYSFSKVYGKIKHFTTSMICYEPDYFKINEKDTLIINGIVDPLQIEKQSFKRQENEYPKLLDEIIALDSKPILIDKKRTELFLETLITIKRRNPSLRKVFIEGFDEYFASDKFHKQVVEISELSKVIDPEGTERYLKGNYLEKLRKKESLQDRFRTRFLKDCEVTKRIVNSLMQHKIYVAHIQSEDEFLTSDNPGFCSIDGLNINIGGFDKSYLFVFPLTPKHCILVDSDYSENASTQKNIYQISLDKKLIENTNRATKYIAMNKVFSLTKTSLEIFQT